MPFSLNLPYAVCYPLTRLVRWASPLPLINIYKDQSTYFDYQYESTAPLIREYMAGVSIQDKVVLDIGSGLGGRSPFWIEKLGAKEVYCIDINRQELKLGEAFLAEKFPHLTDRIKFAHPETLTGSNFGDVALLFDSFEHLLEPAAVLKQYYDLLRPGAKLWIQSIGWYHHNASHCRESVPIPWCQVIFSERAIIRTIQSILHHPDHIPNVWESMEGIDRWDHIDSLKNRPGEPMNMLSLKKIHEVLVAGPFVLSEFKIHSFSGSLTRFLNLLTKIPVVNELFHACYTAILTKPENGQ